jgi:hypothetical protein
MVLLTRCLTCKLCDQPVCTPPADSLSDAVADHIAADAVPEHNCR